MDKPVFTYIWEYEVSPENHTEFARHYGPNGTWADLFRRADGYVSTVLCRDREKPNRFVTLDTWESAEAHAAFCEAFASEYDRLDKECESLTNRENALGYFDYV